MSDPTPSRIKLTVAYDGEPFCGWQSQPGGKAVQDAIEKAIHAITNTTVRIHGSGRTDTGVHAEGQVAHFDPPLTSTLDQQAWLRAINSHLPHRIRIIQSEAVDSDFHARYSAIGKYYRYRIIEAPVLPPQEVARAWHQFRKLDHTLMRSACDQLTGEHDFSAFCANRSDGTDRDPGSGGNVRTIESIKLDTERLSEDQTAITLHFRGSGFLYRMVRMLTGAIVRCGQRKLTLTELQQLLDSPRHHAAGESLKKSPLCAPADGLTLAQVFYP